MQKYNHTPLSGIRPSALSAFVAPVLVAVALLGTIPATYAASAQEQTSPQSAPVTPVALPSDSLSDDAYKAALTALLSDSAKRPGVFASLLTEISRDKTPPHVGVIVPLMRAYLVEGSPEDTVSALKVLSRCGTASQPLLARVLPLTGSTKPLVRAAACEALGGMYYAPAGVAPSCPPSVTKILVHVLETDTDRETQRSASVALGRCRVATPAVLTALTAMTVIDDSEVALGAVTAAQALGPDARPMLSALKVRLADPETAANAANAVLAIAAPEEAMDMFAQVLGTTAEMPTRRVLVYYAGQFPKDATKTTALAAAVKPLMDPLPTSKVEATPEDSYGLRIAAARAYYTLTADAPGAATGLAGVIQDISAPAALRRDAVLILGNMGAEAIKAPAVLPALNVALSDSNGGLQGAAVNVLYRFGGPSAKSVAPRLAELLMNAWKNKEGGRVYSLINAIYRIGPAAKTSATPVLKQIIAREPKNSANSRYAQLALERLSSKS